MLTFASMPREGMQGAMRRAIPSQRGRRTAAPVWAQPVRFDIFGMQSRSLCQAQEKPTGHDDICARSNAGEVLFIGGNAEEKKNNPNGGPSLQVISVAVH